MVVAYSSWDARHGTMHIVIENCPREVQGLAGVSVMRTHLAAG
jgi:hypothetical protein